ncbi:MAG TPA: hypothetical protein VKY27_08890 [Bacteriovoracaceae bacterium]|nr:hypothetical protein [Bacteriovoracaceae bacterium]
MGKFAFATIRLSFILVVISAMLSLAMYSSITSPENSLSRSIINISLELTEEEEERTVREVPEVGLYMDYIATAHLNFIHKVFAFPLYLNLVAQDFSHKLRKPPRLN